MPTIESTFSTFATKCIDTLDHEDLPALTVAIEVMNALESFLWVGRTFPPCVRTADVTCRKLSAVQVLPTARTWLWTLSRAC